MSGDNVNLNDARKAKNDEFYTRLEDIEREMLHYKKHFKGKVVYCNCDDPRRSMFVRYFALNFEHLGLKMLRATGYNKGGRGSELIYGGGVQAAELQGWIERSTTDLLGDGSFDSEECKANLAKADIIVTNPPFSLFRPFANLLFESGKKFLIIGSNMAAGYQDIFARIKRGELWLGCSGNIRAFNVPDLASYTRSKIKRGGVEFAEAPAYWYTNLSHRKRSEPLALFKRIADGGYERYDNYDAIEVGRVADIPRDYTGVMGVPVSFLTDHCPGQFRVIGITDSFDDCEGLKTGGKGMRDRPYVAGQRKQGRVLIQATGA